MNITSIVNYILIAGAIQGFGFNLVTLFIKKKISKPIVFLNLVVFFISLNSVQSVSISIDFFSFSLLLSQLRIPWYFFMVPMFYAFIIHFLGLEKKVNDFVNLSVSIFILEIILRLCLISYQPNEVPGRESSLLGVYEVIEETLNFLYSLFLLIRVCYFIYGKGQFITNILGYDDLNWLKSFIKLTIFGLIFWILAYAVYFKFGMYYGYDLGKVYATVVLYWLAYQGFYRYNLVQDRIFLRRTLASNEMLISSKVYLNVDHKQDDFFNEKHQNDFDKVRNHIIKNKLYLDPLFSMDDIVEELGFSKSYISRLVNSYSNNNFSDFVNSLRVEQAKKFLSDDEFSNYTIVAIGLECGFNSKSTFYSAFKKFTSETPTTFREQY